MEQAICQSCAMPLTSDDMFGTNADGSVNKDYCKWCYDKGEFLDKCTMEEYIEKCSQFGEQAGMTNEQMKEYCTKVFPTLKRWKKDQSDGESFGEPIYVIDPEKYGGINKGFVNLNEALPTNSYGPGRVEAGDVMLYGDDCLVIFYESFDTEYSYTKIGYIDGLPELGAGDVVVRFAGEQLEKMGSRVL